MAFTAHPKLDPSTGELWFFGYRFDQQPYVQVGVLDAEGQRKRTWAVEVPYPVMMHDCALTKDYFVILHLPLLFAPKVRAPQLTVQVRFHTVHACVAYMLTSLTRSSCVHVYSVLSFTTCFPSPASRNAWIS